MVKHAVAFVMDRFGHRRDGARLGAGAHFARGGSAEVRRGVGEGSRQEHADRQGRRRPAIGGPGTSDPGVSIPVTTMSGMLMKAFGVEAGEILGPAVQPRAGANFYSFTAAVPPDTTTAQFQKMFQNLLVERFHLVVHHETRNYPAWELVVDKGGPKLKEAGPQSDDGPMPAGPSRSNTLQASYGNITMKGQSMEDLAQRLGRALSLFSRYRSRIRDFRHRGLWTRPV